MNSIEAIDRILFPAMMGLLTMIFAWTFVCGVVLQFYPGKRHDGREISRTFKFFHRMLRDNSPNKEQNVISLMTFTGLFGSLAGILMFIASVTR